MRERPENFNPAGEDPEVTLVAPRFDEEEARRAHPVVPLSAARPTRASYAHASRARGRRPWTPALLAVALLAVAAVGGAVATKFMQSPRAEQTQEQTEAAPAQTAEAPPPQPITPAAVEAPRENTPVKTTTSGARPRRAQAAAAIAAADSARDVAEDYDEDEDEDRRGKRAEKRRERDEEVEKELRKAMKRAARGKAPRLVDVLTNP